LITEQGCKQKLEMSPTMLDVRAWKCLITGGAVKAST